MLAKDLKLCGGDESISWCDFAAGMKIWRKLMDAVDPDRDDPSPSTFSIRMDSFAFDRLLEMLNRISNDDYQLPSLLDLLQQFYKRKATLPHDLLYALLGIADDGCNYTPDYDRSIKETLIDFAETNLNVTQTIDILYACNFARKSAIEGLPSWVPDWTSEVVGWEYHKHELELYNTTSDAAAAIAMDMNTHVLKVKGARISKIFSLATVDDIWAAHNLWDDSDIQGKLLSRERPFIHSCCRSEAFTRSIFSDLDPISDESKRLTDVVLLRHLESFLRIFFPCVLSSNQSDSWQTQSSIDCKSSGVESLDEPESPTKFYFKSLPVVQRENLFHQFVLRTASHSLLLTESGHMGKAPDGVRVGDLICVILGLRVPVVLREVQGGYTFVSTCFLLDMMDGQAIKQVENGDLTLETFALL